MMRFLLTGLLITLLTSSATRPEGAKARTTPRFQGTSPPGGGAISLAVGGGSATWKANLLPLPESLRPASSLRRGETSRT